MNIFELVNYAEKSGYKFIVENNDVVFISPAEVNNDISYSLYKHREVIKEFILNGRVENKHSVVGISPSRSEYCDAEELKSRVSILAVARKYISSSIKKHEDEYQCLCPFHKEKTASFSINDKKGF